MNEIPFRFHFRQCTNPACGFRYPVTEEKNNQPICPKCGQNAPVCGLVNPSPPIHTAVLPKAAPIILVLDNLRSVFNVGSIFRTADGSGIVQKVMLCGTTPSPEHPKFAKTALGAEKTIPWEYTANTLATITCLKTKSIKLIALEITPTSQNIYTFAIGSIVKNVPVCLIVGNEVAGIDPSVLALSDQVLHIPLHGIKESLNVAIAASIAIYTLYQGMHHTL